jgi:hypothetical protein|tara:strand:+ start:542 stop:916 length:375 start_codon:yes stop_codon:yes gene_type:complete
MNYVYEIGDGIIIGLIFMAKFGLVNLWLNYIEEQAEKERKDISKNKIVLNALKRCFILSIVLTGIFYSSDGSYCVSQDMYGCYEYEYDDDFVPRTGNQAFEYFGIILTVSLVASYYRLSKKFLI